MTFTALRPARGRLDHRRTRRIASVALAALVATAVVAGCEEVGAPEAYRSQVCAVVRSLAGPLPTAVEALQSAAAAGDIPATSAALDGIEVIVKQINGNLVDVPLWQTGAPAVTDLRKIGTAYTAAIADLRAALATGDSVAIQTAAAEVKAARDAAPTLVDSLHAARIKGLNC